MSGTHLQAYLGPCLLGLQVELRFELALWCTLAARALSRAEDDTAELRVEAARNTRLLQIGRIDELVADVGSFIIEADRAALLSILCSMDATELQIYLKMMEVYDLAQPFSV